ncbi:MAG: hypothetical protein AB1641_19735 [Thermodesulfobacteriota bacterium]
MDFERARRQVELVEAKAELQRLALEGDVLLTELRLATDPLMADAWFDLDLARAEAVMTRLKSLWDQVRQVRGRLERLREALGL